MRQRRDGLWEVRHCCWRLFCFCLARLRHVHGGKKLLREKVLPRVPRRRRAAWVAAVGRSSITFNHIPKSVRVCSRHLLSGKTAYEMLESDPDWVPSLHLGHSEEINKRTKRLPSSVLLKKVQKQRRAAETRWAERFKMTQREFQAAGDGSAEKKQYPEVETHDQIPAVKKMDLNFRDFFRNSLEASLDAFSWSRAHSQKSSSVPGEFQVELNFKLPPLREDFSPSSCLNCVKLQRRIKELEEKLFHLTGEQEHTETSTVLNEAAVLSNQVLQSPEPVRIEEKRTGWIEPLSPPLFHEGDQDVDSTNELPPSSHAVQSSSKQKFRPRLRFNPAWLKMFWFLRYSPSLDQMWCHVCRVHADKCHQNLGLIRGSRVFKLDSIKKHSKTIYHKENLKRHSLHR